MMTAWFWRHDNSKKIFVLLCFSAGLLHIASYIRLTSPLQSVLSDLLATDEADDIIHERKAELGNLGQDDTFDLLDNPWFSEDRDPSLTNQSSRFIAGKIGACGYKFYLKPLVYGMPSFVSDYINYERCRSGGHTGERDHPWFWSKAKVFFGERGHFLFANQEGIFKWTPTHRSSDLIYFVISRSNHSDRRAAIRSSWGAHIGPNASLLFLMGGHTDPELSDEARLHGDLIITDVDEQGEASLSNVHLALYMLMWVVERAPNVRFVVHTWDTSYINVKLLSQLLHQEAFAANRIYGQVLTPMKPDRKRISVDQWPWKYYPPFTAGPSYVLSADVVPRMLVAASALPPVPQLEQVYLTGVVALLARVARISVQNFVLQQYPSDLVHSILQQAAGNKSWSPDHESRCVFKDKVFVHNVPRPEDYSRLESVISMDQSATDQAPCEVSAPCLIIYEGKCLLFSKTTPAPHH